MARIGKKRRKREEEISLRDGERNKEKDSSQKKAWSSFKDFEVDESFYCSISGLCPLIPVNFSFNEMDVVRKREVEIREDSSLLVTRNLTPQQVVEFQPRIYYSLTRSDRDSKEKSFDECVR